MGPHSKREFDQIKYEQLRISIREHDHLGEFDKEREPGKKQQLGVEEHYGDPLDFHQEQRYQHHEVPKRKAVDQSRGGTCLHESKGGPKRDHWDGSPSPLTALHLYTKHNNLRPNMVCVDN